ncbi:MAG: outer membrane beta-barrel protein [Verrucomicrobiae bacterium]|nr:outer membrane beta-barrel protein [Verrucomicrobiae bacterium]
MNLKNAVLALTVLAFVGFVSASFADDTRVAGKKSLESRIAELEAKLKDAGVGGGVKGSGIKISGYVDTSYTLNLSDRTESGPAAGTSAQNTGRVFDNQYDSFNLNAFKLTIEKSKDSSKFPAGFRVDTIIGHDAHIIKDNTPGFTGTGESELALEQAYVNLGVPIGNGIDVKVGKMVTLLGYEAIESPANWQFSRSDAFRLSPQTQLGATFGYKWNDTVTTTIGVINGLDAPGMAVTRAVTDTGVEAANFNTDLAFVGRVDVTGPKTSFGDFNAFVAGLYSNDITSPTGAGTSAATRAMNRGTTGILNVGGTWTKPFDVKELTLGVDYLYRQDDASTAAWAAGVQNELVSLAANALSAYGKWDWASLGAKWTSTSGRFSYTHYNNNQAQGVPTATITQSPLVLYSGAGANYQDDLDLYSFTLTQSFNVWKDTLVRLEWRHDWTEANTAGFGAASATVPASDDLRKQQDTIAVNVVYSF